MPVASGSASLQMELLKGPTSMKEGVTTEPDAPTPRALTQSWVPGSAARRELWVFQGWVGALRPNPGRVH